MTLSAEKKYLVNKNLGIQQGAILTIEPGTTIVFEENVGLSCEGELVAIGTPEKRIVFSGHNGKYWKGLSFPTGTIEYCNISYVNNNILRTDGLNGLFKNCDLSYISFITGTMWNNMTNDRLKLLSSNLSYSSGYATSFTNIKYTNIVDNCFSQGVPDWWWGQSWSELNTCNYMCNNVGGFSVGYMSETPKVIKSSNPSYLGTSDIQKAKKEVYDIHTSDFTFADIDLSNMLITPVPEAHGIVWKILVNNIDTQDEFDKLPPLGVGKHKFEVYFNRPMNKEVAPQISFGVRDPWTQQAVAEDGSWNAEGTVYTAWKTIDGKTKSDGLNRIYVHGAQDNEFFEIPYEKTRFNIIVQAAGSMATGFSAEAGLGRVNLTWDNSKNNFDDAMGFNVYRYGSKMKTIPAHYDNNGKWVGETQVPDTVRLNENILDISAKSFVDYEVTPGETYYYYYKVLSTDLQEYDISNVVAATPQTSTLGDANGSGDVNVTDVVWTVNYAVGMDPKPFIFEAADVNKDQTIDVLDVVGIVNLAMSASSRAMTRNEYAQAVYTIEDGMLYVETPITLAGLQVQFAADHTKTMKAAEGLNGFEQASTWFTDNDYMLMAYSFGKKTLSPGKHALLYIGDAELTDIRVSDVSGMKVNVVAGSGTTAISDALLTKTLNKTGIYNLNGQKVAGNANDRKLQHGVYIINGQKVVK